MASTSGLHVSNINIPIGISFDYNYIKFVYVFLTSLFQNNTNVQLEIHALAPDVPVTEQKKLTEFARRNNSELIFYELASSVTKDFALPSHDGAYLSIATYYRVFLADLVPFYLNKILYIDIDTIVVGNIRDLYETDLGEFVIGAVAEIEMPPRPELGITDMANYFNAGVLLINLPEWRAQNITAKISSIAINQSEKVQEYADQDALNMLFSGDWLRLPMRFNVMKAYIPDDLPKREFASFLADKVIVHYNGPLKPWHIACENKFRYLYAKYLHLSPLANGKRYVKRKMTLQAVRRLVLSRVLEVYFNHPIIGKYWRKLKKLVEE